MTEQTRVATNVRLLLILEVLADAGRPLTPTEINAKIGLPKQSIHRLCHTLVELGYLERAQDARRLTPSLKLRRMAASLSAPTPLDIARRQVLEQVANQVHEAVNFVVPDASGMYYLDRVDTDWHFQIQLPIGTHVPFHCTASGKTYLASLSTRKRRKFVECLSLEAHAANTITSQEALMAELETISASGYAVDNQEFLDELVALAVPVHDAEGRFAAAIAFHGPSLRLEPERMIEHLPMMFDAASRLRALLFEA